MPNSEEPDKLVWSNRGDPKLKVNVQEAKAQLSRLLDAAMAGEEVVIAKAGRAVVRLTPIEVTDRTPGAAAARAPARRGRKTCSAVSDMARRKVRAAVPGSNAVGSSVLRTISSTALALS